MHFKGNFFKTFLLNFQEIFIFCSIFALLFSDFFLLFFFQINDKFIIKSGTDFRQFSKITIDFKNAPTVNIEEINVTRATPEDPTVKTILEKYESKKKF